MLRALTAIYDASASRAPRRQALLGCATGMMGLLGQLSDHLTTLPADTNDSDRVRAGVTFTMLRSTEGWAPAVDSAALLREQLGLVKAQLPELGLDARQLAAMLAKVDGLGDSLRQDK